MRNIELVIVLSLEAVFLEYIIVSIYCTNEERSHDDDKLVQPMQWNDEEKRKLLRIYYKVNTGERGIEKRIKDGWDELHGKEMTYPAHKLYLRVMNLIRRGEAERLLTKEERQNKNPRHYQTNMKWTTEMKEKLLIFYYKSDPKKWKQSKRMKELWDNEFPHYRHIKTNNLMAQLRELLKKRGEASILKKLNLTEIEKMDLIRFYHMIPKKKYGRIKAIRRVFTSKYPQYANISCNVLSCYIYSFRKQQPEIYEEISREASASNAAHHSWVQGESSESKRMESTSIPMFQIDDSLGEAEQYFEPNRDNLWIDKMIEEASLSNLHASPNMGSVHQNIIGHPGDLYSFPDVETIQQRIPRYPGDHHHIPNVGTSQQNISGHYWEKYYFPDVGTSQQSISGHFGDYYHIPDVGSSHQNMPDNPGDHYHQPDVGTSHQSILGHPGEKYYFPDVGTSQQVIHSKQRPSNEKQNKSSKGKQPILD